MLVEENWVGWDGDVIWNGERFFGGGLSDSGDLSMGEEDC